MVTRFNRKAPLVMLWLAGAIPSSGEMLISGAGAPGPIINETAPSAPAAVWASETNGLSFTASWAPSESAISYRLDVATHAQFEARGEHISLIDEDFTDLSGWIDSGTFLNSTKFGAASPSRQMAKNSSLISPAVDFPTQLVFFVETDSRHNGKTSSTSYTLNNGATWTSIASFTLNAAGVVVTQALPALLASSTNVRFRFVSVVNSWYLDDVKVTGLGDFSSKFVPGYSNRTVSVTSEVVTGLVLNATYYFRVRAANNAGISGQSPVASVTTLNELPPELPVFTPVGNQIATAGVANVFSVSATGRPDPEVSFTDSTATSGYSFNQLSGALTYTPSFADVGAQSFTFIASNSAGVVTQIVNVTVVPVAPAPPSAIWANNIGSTDFVVEWSAVDGAESYRLDVGNNESFSGTPGGATGGTNYTVNFEGAGETKTAYAATNVTLSGLSWNLAETLIGAETNEFKNGARSARLRGYAASAMTMQANLTNGLGSISFQYRRYATDAQVDWRVDYSTNDALSWVQVGSNFTPPATDVVQVFSNQVGVTGPVRVRIKRATESGAANARMNIDDIVMTPNQSGAPSSGYVGIYSNLNTSGTSELVTGLEPQSNYYFRVRAVNAQGASSSSPTGSATTLPGDPVAPVFVPVAVQTAYVGRTLSLLVEASGIPDPEISLTGATASSGFSFTPDTGRFNYQPPAGDLGLRSFTFVAANSAGSVTQLVSVLVTNAPPEAPVMDPIPAQASILGSTLTYTVQASDADGSTIKYAATSAVASATWSLNTNSGVFAFTPTASQLGTNIFVFRAIDSTSLTSAPVTMVVVVSDQADEVAVSLGAARIVAEEGIATVQIPVSLAFAGTANVQFRFVGPSSGTAQRGLDFNCQTQLLISSSSSGQLIVNVVDDVLVEGPESIIVQMIPRPPASAGAVTQAVLQIRDNDSVSILAGNITSGANQRYEGPGTRMLQALLPDVALLQEFETTNGTSASAYRAWVNETFGTGFHYYVETEAADNIPNGIVSRWPIIASGEWTDPLVPDRDFAWATIDVPGTQHLHAVSVHLKSSSGFESTRSSQARSLTNNITLKGWRTNGYVVVGGDLNLQVRTEEALRILTNIVSDARQSADQVGNRNTNSGRDRPYDLVLPSRNLDARNTTFSSWGYSFANGIVFDTRITWANGLPPPARAGDSAEVNMQHMAAMKLFELEITSTTFMQDQVISFPAIASTISTSVVYLSASAGSGLPVSYRVASGPGTIVSVSNLSFTGAGTVAVVASQAGNATWNPAPEITNMVSVAKANQAIQFPGIDPQIATNEVELFAASSSGLEVQFNLAGGPAQISPDDVLTFSGGGTVLIVARQDGNALYNAAPPVTNTVEVAATVVTNAPVPVPVNWMQAYYPSAADTQYESIVTNTAANGVMSVWQSYVAGLDPNNPTSALTIVAQDLPADATNRSDYILRWTSTSGRVYRIGTKTNIFDAFNWITVPASPPINSYTTTPPAQGIYYRIGVSMEP